MSLGGLYNLRDAHTSHHALITGHLYKPFIKKQVGVGCNERTELTNSLKQVKLALVDSLAGQMHLMEREGKRPLAEQPHLLIVLYVVKVDQVERVELLVQPPANQRFQTATVIPKCQPILPPRQDVFLFRRDSCFQVDSQMAHNT